VWLRKAERAALLDPVDRDLALHQVGQSELSRLRAVENGPRNSVRQIGLRDAAVLWVTFGRFSFLTERDRETREERLCYGSLSGRDSR
jgi:hypothetical protein